MKQMTATEWLGKELESYGDPQFCEIEWEQLDSLIQQAKEMHKQEIINAYWASYKEGQYSGDKTADEYYNETYNSELRTMIQNGLIKQEPPTPPLDRKIYK